MVIIAGLGNPGEEYEGTRHNAGYVAVQELCAKLGFDFMKEASQYRANMFLRKNIGDQEVVFSLPMGYVNNSGEVLRQVLDFYRDNISKDIWIIHDDTEVPFGEIRIKHGGTSGGHNGIKSIDEVIGNDYWRIRIGVGRPANREHDLAKYVLGKFTAKEQNDLPIIIDQAVSYLIKSLEEGKLTQQTFKKINAPKKD